MSAIQEKHWSYGEYNMLFFINPLVHRFHLNIGTGRNLMYTWGTLWNIFSLWLFPCCWMSYTQPLTVSVQGAERVSTGQWLKSPYQIFSTSMENMMSSWKDEEAEQLEHVLHGALSNRSLHRLSSKETICCMSVLCPLPIFYHSSLCHLRSNMVEKINLNKKKYIERENNYCSVVREYNYTNVLTLVKYK